MKNHMHLLLIAASIMDIILAGIGFFAYSNAAPVVVFGVAGVFAGLIGCMQVMDKTHKDERTTSLGIIAMHVIIGLLFLFPIATIEGGEYKLPFKAFGLMLTLSSLFFLRELRHIKH